jgi:hypothetical protein
MTDETHDIIAEAEEIIALGWVNREVQRETEHAEAIATDPDYPAAVMMGDKHATAEGFRIAARSEGFAEETIERVVRFWSHTVN